MNDTRKSRLIYIAGAGHSGSTLLEMLVSGAVGHHGLGEIYQLVDKRNNVIDSLDRHRCSCGKVISECDFWMPTTQRLHKIPRISEGARYQSLADSFARHFGEDHVMVDSSKVPEGLLCAIESDRFAIKVLHIVRDVRAWVVSMQKSYKRNGVSTLDANIAKMGVVKGSMKYAMRHPYVDIKKWYRINWNIEKTADRHDIRRLVVSYERLCFDTRAALNEISEFIDADIADYGNLGARSTNHSILGNRMRFEPEKLRQIQYDDNWMRDDSWLLPYALSRRARRFNLGIGSKKGNF